MKQTQTPAETVEIIEKFNQLLKLNNAFLVLCGTEYDKPIGIVRPSDQIGLVTGIIAAIKDEKALDDDCKVHIVSAEETDYGYQLSITVSIDEGDSEPYEEDFTAYFNCIY